MSSNLDKLNFILINVERAQLSKGAFSMEDCKQFLSSIKTLSAFFSDDKIATHEEFKAFLFILESVKLHQSKGTFTLECSVILLEILESLEKEVGARK